MTNNVDADKPARRLLPSPAKFAGWAAAPTLTTGSLASWLMLRPPPPPYRIPIATICVVAAGTAGFMLLAALVLLVAHHFAARYDDIEERLAHLEQQQGELRSYLVSHGAQIAKLNDRTRQSCVNTNRIEKGLEEMRIAYIDGPQPRLLPGQETKAGPQWPRLRPEQAILMLA